MLRRCIYNFPLMCIFLLLCAAAFFLSSQKNSEKIWGGYYILGVPEGSAEAVAERISEDPGLCSSVVSYYNTSFGFNDFGAMETVYLDGLEERFVEGDPRLDSYMTGGSRLFSTTAEDGSRYELIYIESSLSEIRFYLKIRKIFEGEEDSWFFPDIDIRQRVFSMMLFGICWFFCIWLLKGQRIPAAAAGLPWIAAVAANGAGMLPASVAVFVFFSLMLREMSNDMLYYLNHRKFRLGSSPVLYAGSFAAAFALFTAVNIKSGMPLLPIVSAVAGDALIVIIFYSIKSQRVRMQEHRLFFPVRISGGAVDGGMQKKYTELAASAAAVVIVPLFLLFFQTGLPAEIPVIEVAEGFSDWSWESLDYIDKTYEGLVNPADYIKHKAFQEGFMYGRDSTFPEKDEEITAGHYVSENNEILYREIVIRQFTDEWYTSIINSNNETGLTALLLKQKSPGGISLKSDISAAAGSFNPVKHVIAGLLAFMPIAVQFIRKVRINVRRKGQEA